MLGKRGATVKGEFLRCPAAVKGTKTQSKATVMSNIMMGRRASRPKIRLMP